MSFGKRLKKARKDMNLSRTNLAESLDISYSALSKYETDKRFPEPGILVRISELLGVSLDVLVSNKNSAMIKDQELSYRLNDQVGQENQEIMLLIKQLDQDDKAMLTDFIKSMINRKT